MACGRLGREYFTKYGADPGRIFYFPYEPDYRLIASVSTDEVEQARLRFKLDASRRRVVYSGRMAAVKRVDLLIDAFAALAAERSNWDLVMIGDGRYREQLVERIPSALRHRVTWTGFIDDQAAVSAIYRNCDVLVLPSDYEPWGVVINEAAAAGLAIVASEVVGAAAEIVRDGVNGRLFPCGDLTALVDALRDITAPGRIATLKSATRGVLDDWRLHGDPVKGFCQALQVCYVLAPG